VMNAKRFIKSNLSVGTDGEAGNRERRAEVLLPHPSHKNVVPGGSQMGHPGSLEP